jgi:ketosteroid isomerase-like protein
MSDPTIAAGLPDLGRATVDRFLRAWERAFDDGDYRRMAATYTADARLIATQMETIEGRDATEAFWRSACAVARDAGVHRSVALDEVRASDDLGFMRGVVTLRFARGGPPTRVRYVTIWRRESDGVWRLSVEISSVAPPADGGAAR